jgi:3-deoxy-D-manno-octulosonic-acid transferase
VSLLWAGYRAVAPWAARLAPMVQAFGPAAERAVGAERDGRVPAGPADAWVHGASLGEAGAVEALLTALRGPAPAARFHLTATSHAGRARLQPLAGSASLAPFDAPGPVARLLSVLRPRRLMIVETEIWPHWLLGARERGIPVAFVSARLSARSLARYRWLGEPLRRLIGGLAGVACQTEADATRWLELGAPPGRCVVTGNLKDDALPRPADRAAGRRALGLPPDRPLLVLGSMRPGELTRLAPAWHRLPEAMRARWQVVVVPRHPAASARMRAEARGARLPVPPGPADSDAAGTWRWDDRLGVLRAYYAAGEVAFVGGSLEPHGGHHPLEPAATGAAVVVGPHTETQRASVEALVEGNAMPRIETETDALAALEAVLMDPELRTRRGAAALAVAESTRGAAGRTLDFLSAWGFWPA